MKYNLFIDDERNPIDVKWGPADEQVLFRDERWIIARNWSEVFETIVTYGMPVMISFDHDLGEDEPTGYDIAKRLTELIMDVEYQLDKNFRVLVHSKNPVGAENIRIFMDNFMRVYNG